MLDTDRPEQTADDGAVADAKPACVALVPLVPTVQWSRVPEQQMSRADFVTHLIATAEQAPQTRHLRRASLADAASAYTAHRQTESAGLRIQRIVQA